jgi:hypothetical protein
MDLPAHLLAQAKTFCSVQPCTRFAEGDLSIERDNEPPQIIPICSRHYEYYVTYFGGEDFDAEIIGKETVFVDDVGDDSMIEEIVKRGRPHEIVRP